VTIRRILVDVAPIPTPNDSLDVHVNAFDYTKDILETVPDYIKGQTSIECPYMACLKRGSRYICYDEVCKCKVYQEYKLQQDGTDRG